MGKEPISATEYLDRVCRVLGDYGALLLSVDKSGKPNPMTIGWGTIGVIWGRPIFVVLVRPSRYTYECIEHTGDFTVNVLPRELARLAEFCGSRSGRDCDKFAEAHVTAAGALRVKSPVIEECVLHYECRVVHSNDLVPAAMDKGMLDSLYATGDYHRFFFGEILAVRAEEDMRQRL